MRARSGLGLHNNLLLVLKIHFLPPPFLLSLDIICTYLPRILFLPLRICDVTLHLVEHPRPHFVMTTGPTLSPGREVRAHACLRSQNRFKNVHLKGFHGMRCSPLPTRTTYGHSKEVSYLPVLAMRAPCRPALWYQDNAHTSGRFFIWFSVKQCNFSLQSINLFIFA